MSNIRQLRARDTAIVEPLVIRALFLRLGAREAEASVVASMTELTDLMRRMDHDVSVMAFTRIAVQAQSAQRLAQDLGLVTLTSVLGAVSDACASADPIAVTAIWDRAKRIGDTSFVDLWELPLLRM
ncbi:MAG: hypothetical protein ACK4HW_09765 [Roseinatronobacter sp.]